MTLVIPPGYAQVAYRFLLANDPEEIITTLGVDTDVFPGNLTGATALRDKWTETWGAVGRSASYTFRGVYLRVGQDGGPPVVVQVDSLSVGTGSQVPPPQNCALLVKKQTASGGRANRGRMYLPPYPIGEGDITANGVIADGQVTTLQGVINTWLNEVGAYVVLHDSESPVTTPTPITSFILDRVIATQRRRLRR